MRRTYKYCSLALAWIFIASIQAQSVNERPLLAAKLMALWELEKLFDVYKKECTSGAYSLYDPKVSFQNDPAFFGGVSPQSSYWPEVELSYKKYQERMCEYVSREDFASMYSVELTRDMSTEELVSAISFYASPLGKKLIAGNARANEIFQKQASERMAKLYRLAYADTLNELGVILRKYKSEPR